MFKFPGREFALNRFRHLAFLVDDRQETIRQATTENRSLKRRGDQRPPTMFRAPEVASCRRIATHAPFGSSSFAVPLIRKENIILENQKTPSMSFYVPWTTPNGNRTGHLASFHQPFRCVFRSNRTYPETSTWTANRVWTSSKPWPKRRIASAQGSRSNHREPDRCDHQKSGQMQT